MGTRNDDGYNSVHSQAGSDRHTEKAGGTRLADVSVPLKPSERSIDSLAYPIPRQVLYGLASLGLSWTVTRVINKLLQ